MSRDFSSFDSRNYPVLDVVSGYDQWAETYETVVRDEMDLRLLSRLTSIDWSRVSRAIDLACGTGRIGAWLAGQGVAVLDGLDVTPRMLDRAQARGVYDSLTLGDLRQTPYGGETCDLVTASLVDEHLPDLRPMYAEAWRLLQAGGCFVLVGYHPQFLMTVGMPTHFHGADGEPVAIETHLHLLGDHVAAAHEQGFVLVELHEGLVDDEYVAAKPKWAKYRNLPVSFVFVWQRQP